MSLHIRNNRDLVGSLCTWHDRASIQDRPRIHTSIDLQGIPIYGTLPPGGGAVVAGTSAGGGTKEEPEETKKEEAKKEESEEESDDDMGFGLFD